MKNLQELKKAKEAKASELFKSCGVFWAFSDSQFQENKTPLQEGEKYIQLGAGGYMPKGKYQEMVQGLDEIEAWYKDQVKENKLRYKEICYQLANHESYYTGSLESALVALGEGYTHEEVLKVYRNEYKKHAESYA